MKKFVNYGGSLKNLVLGGWFMKKTINRGDFLKKEGLDSLQI